MPTDKPLFLILKKEFFDQIASGEKTIEYREATDYWRNRLKKPFTTVLFQMGYEKDAPRLLADIVSINVIDGCYEIAIKDVRATNKVSARPKPTLLRRFRQLFIR
jgi:hypothetical protein